MDEDQIMNDKKKPGCAKKGVYHYKKEIINKINLINMK